MDTTSTASKKEVSSSVEPMIDPMNAGLPNGVDRRLDVTPAPLINLNSDNVLQPRDSNARRQRSFDDTSNVYAGRSYNVHPSQHAAPFQPVHHVFEQQNWNGPNALVDGPPDDLHHNPPHQAHPFGPPHNLFAFYGAPVMPILVPHVDDHYNGQRDAFNNPRGPPIIPVDVIVREQLERYNRVQHPRNVIHGGEAGASDRANNDENFLPDEDGASNYIDGGDQTDAEDGQAEQPARSGSYVDKNGFFYACRDLHGLHPFDVVIHFDNLRCDYEIENDFNGADGGSRHSLSGWINFPRAIICNTFRHGFDQGYLCIRAKMVPI